MLYSNVPFQSLWIIVTFFSLMVTTRSQARVKRSAQPSSIARKKPYLINIGPGRVKYVLDIKAYEVDPGARKTTPTSLRWLGLDHASTTKRMLCRFRHLQFAETADQQQRAVNATSSIKKPVRLAEIAPGETPCSHAVVGFSSKSMSELQLLWSFMVEPNFHYAYAIKHFPKEEDTTERECSLCYKSKTQFGKCIHCAQAACTDCLTEWVETKLTCPFCRHRNMDVPLRSDTEV